MTFILQKIFRSFRYENWPFWLFYAPVVPFWLWCSIRLRSFTYFTLANPKWKNGGFSAYSKSEILACIDATYYAAFQTIEKTHTKSIFPYPFVAKPDIGERGIGVALIRNDEEWQNYQKSARYPLMVQQYIDYPLEFGLFYVRMPDEAEGKILHITSKKFLTIKGDGLQTFGALLQAQNRARKRIKFWKEHYADLWDLILEQDKEVLIEPIGNHNRGTEFTESNRLITKQLQQNINKIAKGIPAFYYGRFDVKAKDTHSFQKGHFVILELNGTNSEPTHIYDPQYTIWKAYREVFTTFNYQFRIAQQNRKRNYKARPLIPFIRDVYQHLCSLKNFKKT